MTARRSTRPRSAIPKSAVPFPAALAVVLALATGGCVSFDLGAKDIVTDTVSAGKALYRTLRHRRNGTEERLYSHTVPIAAGRTETETAIGCLNYLRGLADAATESTAKVLAEGTEIVETDDGRSMRCTLTAVVPSSRDD